MDAQNLEHASIYRSESILGKSISHAASFAQGGCAISAPTDRITISFENITYSVKEGKNRKHIINNLSGEFRPGTMVALMGASGSGKTTLLNIVARRNRKNGGRVLFNGHEVQDSAVSRLLAFVQQDDLFFGSLTVREHLLIQAKLRLPASLTTAERVERVDTVIQSLGLTKCKDSRIGNLTMNEGRGISGGERKRLNIASELLMAPAIIFADEITTGLDSFVALTAIQAVRQYADRGRTVVCTIHQPSARVFEMFDELLLMSEGSILYFGDRLGALSWFSRLGKTCLVSSNPAEFIVKTVAVTDHSRRKEKMEELCKWSDKWTQEGKQFKAEWAAGDRAKWIEEQVQERAITYQRGVSGIHTSLADHESARDAIRHTLSKTSIAVNAVTDSQNVAVPYDAELQIQPLKESGGLKVAPITAGRRINCISETGILFYRAFITDWRTFILIIVRIVQVVVFGLMLGFIYFRLGWNQADARSKIGAVYLMLMNQSMMNAMTVSNRVPLDMPIIRGEYRSGAIRVPSYIWGKMLADLPVQLISTTLFSIVTYYLVGYNDKFTRYLECWAVILLTMMAATSLGYLASCIADSVQTALAISLVLILPNVIVSGFMVRLADIPDFWIWLKFISFLRYGFSAMSRIVFYGETIHLDNGATITGEELLNTLSLDTSLYFFRWSIGGLAILTICLRILASAVLTIRMAVAKSR